MGKRAIYSLCGLILAFAIGASSAEAAGREVFSHRGAANPQPTWGITPGDSTSNIGLSAVITGPLPAWKVSDLAGGIFRYERIPSANDLADGTAHGWRVLVVLNLPLINDPIDAATIVEFADGSKRFALEFGTDPNGNPIVGFFGSAGTRVNVPEDGFHTYEMIYNPDTSAAQLWIDGTPHTSYTGLNGSLTRFNFGSGSSSGQGVGEWNEVRWEILGDSDADQVSDEFDLCPFIQNPPNEDAGGVGAGSGADGIGDRCQCFEVTDDGIVDPNDAAALARYLVDPNSDPLSSGALARCRVGEALDSCDIETYARVSRAVIGLLPSLVQNCRAATGFGEACGDGVCTDAANDCHLAPRGCQQDCGACLLGTSCLADGDCASTVCIDGTCEMSPAEAGVVKPGDGICDATEHCYRNGPGADPDSCGPCPEDAYCHNSQDCAAGLCTDDFGRCNRGADQGNICYDATQCEGGIASCVPEFEGFCLSSPNPGTVCSTDDDCGVFPIQTQCVLFGIVPLCEPPCSTPCITDNDCICNSCELTGTCQDGSRCQSNLGCDPDDDACLCGNLGPCEDERRCVGSECGEIFAELCGLDEPCVSSADCEPELFCYALASKCVDTLPDGVPCTLSSQCESGICNYGFCVAQALPNGVPCTTDSACQGGNCLLGFCATVNCGDGTCSANEHCGSNNILGNPGEPCAADCGTCGDLTTCTADIDCTSGYCSSVCLPCRFANDGRCPNGRACDTNSDCQTNNCVSGFCAPTPPPCSGSNRPDGCSCGSNGDCASNRCVDPPGSAGKVCTPSGCDIPGDPCINDSECCDFPTVPMGCSFFTCQPE